MTGLTCKLAVAKIDPNPDQPRKLFDPDALQELADSILSEGLLQAIKVRPKPGGRYEIVAGERRWRAHKLAGLKTIEAKVADIDDATMRVQALVENAVRKDVTALEEAAAFQMCLDAGMSAEELTRRLGRAPNQAYRVAQRTCLLNLEPEYQTLLRGGGLTPTQGYEMAQLSAGGQAKLFSRIREGGFDDLSLRAIAAEIGESEKQGSMFEMQAGPSESVRRLAISLENRFYRVASVLRASTVDCEVVAVRKVNPNRAESMADIADQMAAELGRIAAALRESVGEQEMAA